MGGHRTGIELLRSFWASYVLSIQSLWPSLQTLKHARPRRRNFFAPSIKIYQLCQSDCGPHLPSGPARLYGPHSALLSGPERWHGPEAAPVFVQRLFDLRPVARLPADHGPDRSLHCRRDRIMRER